MLNEHEWKLAHIKIPTKMQKTNRFRKNCTLKELLRAKISMQTISTQHGFVRAQYFYACT